MALQTTAEVVEMLKAASGETSPNVTYAGSSSYGVEEAPGEVVLGEGGQMGVISSDPSVLVATGAFSTAFAVNGAITVGGVAKKIREHLAVDDGALTRIWLREA